MGRSIRSVALCLVALSSVPVAIVSAQRVEAYSRHSLSYEYQEGRYDDIYQEGKIVTKGLSYGFMRGIGVSRAIPLAVEFGGRLVWTHGVDKDWYYEISRKDFLSVVLPVNAVYRLSLFNDNLTVAPFFGPTFRFNVIGLHYYETRGSSAGHTDNFLSRRKDTPANIFQFGTDIGVGFAFRRFYVGYTFQYDLTGYMEKLEYGGRLDSQKSDFRTSSSVVSVGMEF